MDEKMSLRLIKNFKKCTIDRLFHSFFISFKYNILSVNNQQQNVKHEIMKPFSITVIAALWNASKNFTFYFSVTVYIQHCFVLVAGAQHSAQRSAVPSFSKCSLQYLQYPPGTLTQCNYIGITVLLTAFPMLQLISP